MEQVGWGQGWEAADVRGSSPWPPKLALQGTQHRSRLEPLLSPLVLPVPPEASPSQVVPGTVETGAQRSGLRWELGLDNRFLAVWEVLCFPSARSPCARM